MRNSDRLVALFPFWAVIGAFAALLWPAGFGALGGAIVPLLGVVMFGMGLTLTTRDFAEVFRRPRLIWAGEALQFGIMPFAGWLVGRALQLNSDLLAGVVLVGACPGGTASNVICYLARGDVALSITLTSISTLMAVFATPALTWLYVGQSVPVPVVPMLWSIVQVVLVPVVAGVAVNQLLGPRLGRVRELCPIVSVGAIVLIIAVVVALNAANLAQMAWSVAAAVVLHNGLGLGSGYVIPKLLGAEERVCRTFSIEVGMQNSGLGVALATQFFSAAAALPGAVFSVWHNLSGSLLAGYWARRSQSENRRSRSAR